MSTLYITEYSSLGRDFLGNQPVQAGMEPGTDQTPVTISGTTAASAAVAANTGFVRIIADVDCHIVFGTAPTATTNNKLMAADTAEYFAVPRGVSMKVAVVAAA